jgi:NAD(P)-dependent dehydrogenase (short-subunit alcohol dehydrogenase family)
MNIWEGSFKISQRVVVITGGASGIGLTIAQFMLEAGVRVICVDFDEIACNNARKMFLEKGHECLIVNGDIRNPDTCQSVLSILNENKLTDWTLINNASLRIKSDILSETPTTWKNQMDVMLSAPFMWMQDFMNYLLDNRDGKGLIINISSVASRYATGESPAYHAAKAGLESLTRFFSVHAPRLNINLIVCALRVGYVLKETNKESFWSTENNEYAEKVKTYLPGGAIPTDKLLAEMIYWIFSNYNKFINGAVIDLDSGANNQDPWFLLNNKLS